MHRGKHWRAPTYTVSHTPRHARLNTTSTPARDHEHHGCPVQRPPHPARRRGADACSRLWQQSRILYLALARVSGASRELTLARHIKIRDHVSQLPRNTIVSCILVSITAPVCCAAAPPNAVSKVFPARPCPFPLRRDDQYFFRLQSSNNPQTFPLSTFSVNVLPVPLSPVGAS
jgi:hypothetical protein